MAAVEVEGLTVRYGTVTAVEDASFEAPSGQVTALLGPNGAGKTTTVEVLEGFRRPSSGRASVLGLVPVDDHVALTRRIGVMLQSGGVGPGVRVGEAVRHAAALYDDALDPAAVIDQVGLTGMERRSWRQLSGGEQRRLALALALVGRPQVAFLDEPGSGVDPEGRRAIRQVVARLRDDGVTVVLTSHDLDEVEILADHVVILDHGRVVASGSPESLMRSGAVADVRFRAPAGLDVGSLSAHLAATVADPGGRGPDPAGATASLVEETAAGEYVVHAGATPALVAALTAWLASRDVVLGDLRAGRARLEDVFLRLVGAQDDDRSSPDTSQGRQRR